MNRPMFSSRAASAAAMWICTALSSCGPGAQGQHGYGAALTEACDARHSQTADVGTGAFQLHVEARAPFRAWATREDDRQVVVCADTIAQESSGMHSLMVACEMGTAGTLRLHVRAIACRTEGENCLDYSGTLTGGQTSEQIEGYIPRPGCDGTSGGAQ